MMTLEQAASLKAGQRLRYRSVGEKASVTMTANGTFYPSGPSGLYPAIGATWARKQVRLIYLDADTLSRLELV